MGTWVSANEDVCTVKIIVLVLTSSDLKILFALSLEEYASHLHACMHVCMYVCLSVCLAGWIFEKVIDSYKPGVPSTPLPNFPVSSSSKNRNCLNIRTSLDILDNRHPRK